MKAFLISFLFIMMMPMIFADREYGTFYERECSDSQCTQINYLAPTYMERNGQWIPILNDFTTGRCDAGYDYCMKDSYYSLDVKNDFSSQNLFNFDYQGYSLRFKPLWLEFRTATENRTISLSNSIQATTRNNQLRYNNTFLNGIEISYTLQPSSMKQQMIIPTNKTLPDSLLSGNVTLDYVVELILPASLTIQENKNIEFINSSDDVLFYFPQPYAVDSKGARISFDYKIIQESKRHLLSMQIPLEWLTSNKRVYPITIDPTIVLNESDILSDGHVQFDVDFIGCSTNQYTRFTGLPNLDVGNEMCDLLTQFSNHGFMEWNLTGIASTATIVDVNFSFFVESNSLSEPDITLKNMDGNSTTYPDTNAGNQQFYIDIGNGTSYGTQTVPASNVWMYYNLSDVSSNFVKQELESKLGNGTNWFGIGFHTIDTLSDQPNVITAIQGASAQRARLQIDYTVPVPPDTSPPEYYNITEDPRSNTTLALVGNNYVFNITWIDDINISDAYIVFDSVNYTIASGRVTVLETVYSFNETSLGLGDHNYTWFANDTSNNGNQTALQTYTTISRFPTWEFAIILAGVLTVFGTAYSGSLLWGKEDEE